MDSMDDLEEIKQRKLEELMRIAARGVGHPLTLSDSDFDLRIQENHVILVDFWADWCMPCRMMAPVLEGLATKHVGKIAFGKLNVDENQSTAQRFEVYAIPTLILFVDGKPVDRMVGYADEEQLEEHLKTYVK